MQKDAANNQKGSKQGRQRPAGRRGLGIRAGGELGNRQLQDSAFARLEAIERKRTRARAFLLGLLVLTVLLMTLAVVRILQQRSMSEPILQFLMEDVVDESFEARGVIVRDEVLYSAGIQGLIRPLQPEGSKVAKQEVVALVLPPAQQAVYAQWKALSAEIAKRRLQLIAQGQGQGSDALFVETDGRMSPLLDELRRSATRGSVANADSYQSSIDALIYGRNLKMDAISFDDESLSALRAQLQVLEEQLDKLAVQLQTDSSGYISYLTDGQESILTPRRLEQITEENLQVILDQGERFKPIAESVANRDPAYRLSRSSGQYFVFLIRGLAPDYFAERSEIGVYLPKENLEIASCVLVKAAPAYGGEGTLLITRSSSQVESLIGRRIIEGRVVVEQYVGLKVPNHVLIDYDEGSRLAKLMVVRNGATQIVPVRVTARNDRYSRIADIEQNDYLGEGTIYVENGRTVREGTAID